ncbi:MAG TPA: hypothetical protein V6D34_03295 [Candidatus Sericytochromatia bacterium]
MHFVVQATVQISGVCTTATDGGLSGDVVRLSLTLPHSSDWRADVGA